MKTGQFHLVKFDEGGLAGPLENRRLVCVTDDDRKLAIWGQESPQRNMRNIEALLNAGMPCTVECEYRMPADWAKQKGHTHWVPQDSKLRVLPQLPGGAPSGLRSSSAPHISGRS
jgi:hypothetical protein